MKYVIVYLVKGKARKYHQYLVKNIGPKFGERYLIENPLPSHITLKSPFFIKDIKIIEDLIKEVVMNYKKEKIEIEGVGNFRKFVVFLKVNLSKNAIKIQKNLIKKLEKIKDVEIKEFDRKWKPHITIAYGNSKETFNGIWKEVKNSNPKYNLEFDNITILKKPRNKWAIHKEYKLK